MYLYCDKSECVHCGEQCCEADCCFLDEDGYCTTFEDYTDLPQYQSEYFAAVQVDKNTIGKLRKQGRKIIINGYTFYSEDNYETRKDNVYVTEERTGYSVGTVKRLKEKWDVFVELCAKLPDIKNYTEYAYSQGKLVPVENSEFDKSEQIKMEQES